MSVGVRMDGVNPRVARQFRRALDFWTTVVDMEWHEDNSDACSFEVIQVQSGALSAGLVAEADFPTGSDFRGLVKFDRSVWMSKKEIYYISAHEIGHLLGLEHNPSRDSVMYFEEASGPERLDRRDLAALAKLHSLRRPRMESEIDLRRAGWRLSDILVGDNF